MKTIQTGDFKAQVLQAVNIVELIGRSVALKQRGKDYLGLCPFHQEKTPSFHVNPARQFFYCFGCKAGGNAINFVMLRDRVEFRDALRTLADSVGLEMPRFNGAAQAKESNRQALFDMQSAACAFFEKQLQEPTGEAARKYLAERGFNEQSIRRFQIGLAPDGWDGLLRSPVGRKFPPEQLLVGGLVKKREKGPGYYDTFRNRLMFPIRDEGGRVIAFGGRVMPGGEDPKYLNSPETPLFSKSRCVFGLDLARQKIVETRTAVVVEGYTDVVMSHQFGAEYVVSPLGTAMTEQHVGILRRFADRIVLLFDADSAGDAAVDRAVGLFLTQPVEIAIASMPEGVDPDEFLLQHGNEGFQKLVDGAADALTYKWKQLHSRFSEEADSLTAQQKAVEQYMEVLSSARGSGPVDPLRWGGAVARVSRLTDIPVEQLNRRFRATRTVKQPVAAPAPEVEESKSIAVQQALDARQRAERRLLGVLLIEPQRWLDVQKKVSVEHFADPAHRRLAEIYWVHQRDEGEPVFNEFLGLLTEPSLVEVAVSAAEEAESLSAPAVLIEDAMAYFAEVQRTRETQKIQSEIRQKSPEQDEGLLLKKLQEQARQPNLRRA